MADDLAVGRAKAQVCAVCHGPLGVSTQPDTPHLAGQPAIYLSAQMKAYRNGTLPFPDGSVLAKLAWKHVPSTEMEGAFVPGRTTTVQIMVKDSKKYASTGGWGFGRFIDGKAVDEAQHQTCFPCHQANVKDHDFVFTRYAP